jgi:uncharacterized repeat protein (TIGR03803 family)
MSQILDFFAKCLVGCALALAVCGPYTSARARGVETVRHSFCSKSDCEDGETPEGGLIMDGSGNLYGTTSDGGANWGGNVFEIRRDGTYRVLYAFCAQANCTDGSSPSGNLIMDGAGKLYGTTFMGGTGNSDFGGGGTVFSIDTATGAETVLYNFCSRRYCNDGQNPAAGVIMDGTGNLYGTTENGGGGVGTGAVFKLARGGKEKVVYSFDADGPVSGVIMDSAGNLYGTTVQGGPVEEGDVFEVTPDGTFKELYAFCSQSNCSDGDQPWAREGLIMDGAGNLYGTTKFGGVNDYGTVFKVTPAGAETVLYDLCSRRDCSDGANPAAGLMMDGAGNLYGTTLFGVGRHCQDTPYVCGAVFKLTPDGAETTLYSFCSTRNCTDGGYPAASLIMDSSGNLHGTTLRGGRGHCMDGCGTVFELSPGGMKKE